MAKTEQNSVRSVKSEVESAVDVSSVGVLAKHWGAGPPSAEWGGL